MSSLIGVPEVNKTEKIDKVELPVVGVTDKMMTGSLVMFNNYIYTYVYTHLWACQLQ